MCSSPALKLSSLAQNVFVPRAEVFVSSTINAFIFYMEGGFENLQKKTKYREISYYKTSFQLEMGLKKGQKQGRHERALEDYPTSAVHIC